MSFCSIFYNLQNEKNVNISYPIFSLENKILLKSFAFDRIVVVAIWILKTSCFIIIDFIFLNWTLYSNQEIVINVKLKFNHYQSFLE